MYHEHESNFRYKEFNDDLEHVTFNKDSFEIEAVWIHLALLQLTSSFLLNFEIKERQLNEKFDKNIFICISFGARVLSYRECMIFFHKKSSVMMNF